MTGHRPPVARRDAADIDVMGHGGDISEQAAVGVHRGEQLEIGEVRRTVVGVVRDDDVALGERAVHASAPLRAVSSVPAWAGMR